MSSVSVIRREIRLKDQHITNHYDKLLIDEKAWTREFSELFRLFRQLKQLDTSEFREAFGELYQPLFDIGYGEGQEGTEDHRLYNEVFDDELSRSFRNLYEIDVQSHIHFCVSGSMDTVSRDRTKARVTVRNATVSTNSSGCFTATTKMVYIRIGARQNQRTSDACVKLYYQP